MATYRWSRGYRRAALAVIAVALSGGCSEGTSDAKPLTEASRETGASHVSDGKHAQALAAYRAMWADAAVAATTSDPEHPRLKSHASEGALELLRYMMRKAREKGVVTKGRLRIEPAVKSGDARTVVVRDCADGSDWLHYTPDGDLYNDVPGGHHRVDATLQQRGGVWRVEHLYIHELGSC